MKQLPDGRFVLYEDFPIFAPQEFSILEADIQSIRGDGKYTLKGLFHLAEKINANGRIYPKKLLIREINNIMPLIKSRSVYGSLDHPEDPTIKLSGPGGASHLITELKMKGNHVYGALEALSTENGENLKAVIRDKGRLGISSRGLGSLEDDGQGRKIVQEDYSLLTWDVVPNPSTPDAWLAENIKISEKNKISQDINEVTDIDLLHKVQKLLG